MKIFISNETLKQIVNEMYRKKGLTVFQINNT
jgi:hypothetical protein